MRKLTSTVETLNCVLANVRTATIAMMLTLRTLPRAQFNVLTLEVNFAFHKLDALRIMVLTIMACALVVSSPGARMDLECMRTLQYPLRRG